VGFDVPRGDFGVVGGVSVDDEMDGLVGPGKQALAEFDERRGVHTPGSGHEPRLSGRGHRRERVGTVVCSGGPYDRSPPGGRPGRAGVVVAAHAGLVGEVDRRAVGPGLLADLRVGLGLPPSSVASLRRSVRERVAAVVAARIPTFAGSARSMSRAAARRTPGGPVRRPSPWSIVRSRTATARGSCRPPAAPTGSTARRTMSPDVRAPAWRPTRPYRRR
jgi:hypothetical protein